ncbi:MAG: ABC transporter permease [Deltaproteobacteria bacterium]|nr:ABC transporter permease [Deltaproteobacteria bacterium]MBW2153797.1 ABC transporter permease [Deltaproteobacteria bacterium]
MVKYIGYRMLTLIPVLLGASFLVFSLFWIVPGDVVDIMVGDEAFGDSKAEETLRKTWNLDKPFYIQYALWLWRAVHGDLGVSFVSGHEVTATILDRLPVNIQMISIAMFFVIVIGITTGVMSAYRQFSIFDHIVRFLTTLGYSVPNFWAATITVLLGSLYFRWLPVLEYVPFTENPLANIKCMLLPGFVLGLSTIALVARMSRSTALDTLRQDYVRTARAKGAPEKIVLFVHVLKNSLIPVVTILGFQVGVMIGGFVLTEQVFVLPGLGSMILEAILERDLVTVTGGIVFLATTFVVLNLIVDVIYCFLDPRIRY